MSFSQSFFAERFGITEHDLESYLSEALSAGGDYADVYFEYLATSSIGIDEQIVKSATEGVSMGAGVRVIAGERTGYAYSDDLSPAKIRKAAHTAALIAKGPASVVKAGFEEAQMAGGDLRLAGQVELAHAQAQAPFAQVVSDGKGDNGHAASIDPGQSRSNDLRGNRPAAGAAPPSHGPPADLRRRRL